MRPKLKASMVVALIGVGALAFASAPSDATIRSFTVSNVAGANPRAGVMDNVLSSNLRETPVAWGNLPLVNADTTLGVTHYGYDTSAHTTLTQDPAEAYKTEPDKNVYLVMDGHHYLYQGHEGGPHGYVTRIDLDETDPTRRVSLVADLDSTGAPLPTFDGITWDPFSRQLLLTVEAGAPKGGVFAVTLDSAGNATTGRAVRIDAMGSGGYEGIQNDSAGNVWIVEDIGGSAASGGKVPNSYIYRYLPSDPADLTAGGTLQALQVKREDGTPATAAQLQADPTDAFLTALHTYGKSFHTAWVTVHGASDSLPYSSTASAASSLATPFKRPENGVFRPGTSFGEFYFSETGDTSALSTLPGAYGAVFRLKQSSPTASKGVLEPVMTGDQKHTGFDNVSFAGAEDLLVVEDAGDTLHGQRNALDSGYDLKLDGDVAKRAGVVRWLAEGRDASAYYDATWSPGYNDGDNEITGIHVSDGDPTIGGILGAKIPKPFNGKWRMFWTQQHGENVTWEVRRVD